jgi:pantetheine-phosphate adenylyltransferase
MSHNALFPGSFDPPTLGHLDCVLRAAQVFGRVTVLVSAHPTKSGMFDSVRRVALFEQCLADASAPASINVERHAGLLVDAAREFDCQVVVRGARSGQDFEYEAQMASTNRQLLPGLETLILVSAPALAHTSSTLVRQIAKLGGDVSSMVPAAVVRALSDFA